MTKKMGRPPKMKDARSFTVSLPGYLLRKLTAEAKRTNETRGEIVRVALANHLQED